MSGAISEAELESIVRRVVNSKPSLTKEDIKPLETKVADLCAQFPSLCKKVDGLAEGLEPSGVDVHRTLDEQLACPNCRPKIDSAVYKNLVKAEGYCDSCHYPIFDWENSDSCPNCRGTKGTKW